MGTKATESMIYLFIIEIVNYLHFIPYYFNQLLFKVHMKRFFTVVFHFIIVQINIKESYIT